MAIALRPIALPLNAIAVIAAKRLRSEAKPSEGRPLQGVGPPNRLRNQRLH